MPKKSSQTKGNVEDTPSDGKTSKDASASFGDGGTEQVSKFLGRFDTEEAAQEHLEKVEESNKKNYAELQRALNVINKLQGISGLVELDPVTGMYDLRPDLKAKIAGGGEGKDVALNTLKEELKSKFLAKAGEDPQGALIDVIVEAATRVAESTSASVRSEVGGIQTQTMLSLYIAEHPEAEVLLPYAQAWMQKNLTPQARRTVSVDDVFELVKTNLKRTGRLDQIGYEEPGEDEEGKETKANRSRGKQKLTTGSGGRSPDETSEEKVAGDKKIKEEIAAAATPLDRFLSATTRAKTKAGAGNPFGIV